MRILILAYYFPPLNSTASHRPYSWASTWSKAGHEVVVLTTQKYAFDGTLDLHYDLSGFEVTSVPYLRRGPHAAAGGDDQAARRAAHRWDRFKLATRRVRLGAGLFGEFAWFAYAALLRKARALAAEQRFDFVISTSPPDVLHFVGYALWRKTGIPWVADYRDLWFPDMRVNQYAISAWLTSQLKRPRLRDAVAVSTISEGVARRLSDFLGREVFVCYNGYMPEAVGVVGSRPWPDAKRHLVYTGRMFPGKRDPEILLRGLSLAMRDGGEVAGQVMLDIYGFDDQWIRRAVTRHQLNECVTFHGHVAHAASLNAQRHADELIFLDWKDTRAEGILTGKLFEYLASGRPILGIGNRRDSEAARIIRESGSGVVLCGAEEVNEHLRALAQSATAPSAPRAGIERFSRVRQAEALLDYVSRVLRS